MLDHEKKCNCRTMVRIPDVETDDGKYPMPDHHRNCNIYKLERFVKISTDKVSFIVEPAQVQEITNNIDSKFVLTDVFLTQDQFDNLKEFSGF